MKDSTIENYKSELRKLRERQRKEETIFEDLVPVKYTRDGAAYVEPIWLHLDHEDILRLHRELDEEEDEIKNKTARDSEVKREREVNGRERFGWFHYEYWWGF